MIAPQPPIDSRGFMVITSPPFEAKEVLDEIPSAPCPDCRLCGSRGEPLYGDLEDRLFGAPGVWRLNACPKEDCGLIWLNPAPLPEHLGRAYKNYYTHGSADGETESGLRAFYHGAVRSWLSRHYGYPPRAGNFGGETSRMMPLLGPLIGRRARAQVRYLPFVESGRLLDVGCGDGSWLLEMKGRGWNVEGVDFDPSAVAAARRRGLTVHQGSVETQNYPAESFDAIHLFHVIEHVTDPIGTVRECARLLRPRGRLVIFTPNTASVSHRLFKEDWRGLEPPRHLHLFSFASMRRLFEDMPFANVSIRPQVGISVTVESWKLWRGRRSSPAILDVLDPVMRSKWFRRMVPEFLQTFAGVFPAMGETMAVVATMPGCDEILTRARGTRSRMSSVEMAAGYEKS